MTAKTCRRCGCDFSMCWHSFRVDELATFYICDHCLVGFSMFLNEDLRKVEE